MSNKIPLAIADFETQISGAIGVGDTSFNLASATDDDGNALPAGKYCFTINNGSSNKQYLLGQLNSLAVTSVVTVSRQGVETSGAAVAARSGSPVIISDFATIQRVADILRGEETLDGASPIVYDAEPTLSDRKELATVGYVLDTAFGGSLAFDAQTIAATAGEAIVAGNLVYFKTSDQEWYKTDADTAATVEGVQLGIALGTGSDGVAITGGVQISGTYTTTGLTQGALYYASNTAGAIASSAGTTARVIGIALSTTKLLLIPRNPQDIKDAQKDALVGGATFGTPSSTNKFITQDYNASATGVPVVRTYLNAASPATWTKPAGLKYVVVEVQAAGGAGGGGSNNSTSGGGGGGGGYSRKLIPVASLGATETVTIGAVGNSSSFGSHASATSGSSGAAGGSGGSGGVPGVGSSGDVNCSGQGGGGGGSNSTAETDSGVGGSSYFGAGGPSVAGNDASGVAGGDYGGGGSGACGTGSAGAGGPAIVIVTEYYS